MKKIIALALILLVIAAAALPAVIGPLTEKQLRQSLVEISAKQNTINAELTSYERGYRSATATIRFGLSEEYLQQIIEADADPDSSMGPAELAELKEAFTNLAPLVIDLEHGPVLTKYATGLGLNSYRATLGDNKVIKIVREATGLTDLFEMIGKTGLTGSSAFDLSMPAMKADLPEDVSVDFSGLTGQGTWNNGSQRIVMAASSEALSLGDAQFTAKIDDISMDIDSLLVEAGLGVGTSNITLAHIEAQSPMAPAPVLTVDGLVITSEVAMAQDSLFDLSLGYRIDEAAAQGITVSNASAEIRFEGISGEVIQTYQEVMSNPDMGPDQIAELEGLLRRALIDSPKLHVGPIKFETDGEQFDGVFKVMTDGDTVPPTDAFNIADPGMWMTMLSATLDLRATEGLVHDAADAYLMQQTMATLTEDQADIDFAQLQTMVTQQRVGMLEQLVGQGMITLGDDGYVVDVDFDKGEMLINGNPFPLEALLGP